VPAAKVVTSERDVRPVDRNNQSGCEASTTCCGAERQT
jgi:hypothetical protein